MYSCVRSCDLGTQICVEETALARQGFVNLGQGFAGSRWKIPACLDHQLHQAVALRVVKTEHANACVRTLRLVKMRRSFQSISATW